MIAITPCGSTGSARNRTNRYGQRGRRAHHLGVDANKKLPEVCRGRSVSLRPSFTSKAAHRPSGSR
jgi:hypothetical protein